jgi:putative nucleotidyltransferase with HDIG domain
MKPESLLADCARWASGRPLYLVGGGLRDRRLGRPVVDYDLVLDGPARDFAKELSRRLKGTLVVLDDLYEIYRVVLRDRTFLDVAAMQGGSIEADLGRRDFTINAMAERLGPDGGRLLDPYGGLADVRKKRLRAMSEEALKEDPLRALRAYRFAAELGFELEPKTERWVARHAVGLEAVAGERVRQELTKLLACRNAASWLRRMDKTRVLTTLVPELEASRGCAKVYYGREGVLGHTLKTCERLDLLLERLDSMYSDLAEDLGDYLASRPPALLRMTALLHDVAKPKTAKKRGDRLRFFGHEEQGAEMADKILERLRFSQAERRSIGAMIRHHLRPGNLAANPRVSERAAFRYFSDLGDDGLGLAMVCWADYASYMSDRDLERVLPRVRQHPNRADYDRLPAASIKTLRHLQVAGWLMQLRLQSPDRVVPPKLADGHDVMKLLGLPPGPEIGRVLQEVREAQADGRVTNRNQAMAYLKALKPPKARKTQQKP